MYLTNNYTGSRQQQHSQKPTNHPSYQSYQPYQPYQQYQPYQSSQLPAISSYQYTSNSNSIGPYAYNFHNNVRSSPNNSNTNGGYNIGSNEMSNNGYSLSGNTNKNTNSNSYTQKYNQYRKQAENQQIQQNNSFIDKFDNNNSSLLRKQKSHARNLRGRLYNNQQPTAQRAKQDKMKSYRDQLQKQMKADQQRKQAQKKKIDAEQMKRQQRFYEQFKIEAHKGSSNTKQPQNPYFMMRTHQKIKRKQNNNNAADISNDKSVENKEENNKANNNKAQNENQPKISRRAYHNRSHFDNPDHFHTQSRHKTQKQKTNPLQQALIQERQREEQRIAKIVLFQQNVLRKLTDIKQQIRATSNILDTDSELQKVRASLRVRNIKHFTEDLKKSSAVDRNNPSQFYSLPRKNARPILPHLAGAHTRQPVKTYPHKNQTTHRSQSKSNNTATNNNDSIIDGIENNQSRITQNPQQRKQDRKHIFNDKNVIGEEPEQSLDDQ